MNVRYRYRGNSGKKVNYQGNEVIYNRPQSFCHLPKARYICPLYKIIQTARASKGL